jgi:hypothetical protein
VGVLLGPVGMVTGVATQYCSQINQQNPFPTSIRAHILAHGEFAL